MTIRALTIACGISALLSTLAFCHIMHHHLVHASHLDFHTLLFGALALLAVSTGILSSIGGILFLKHPR